MCPGYIDAITDINEYKIVWMDLWAAVEIFEPHREAKTKFSNPEMLTLVFDIIALGDGPLLVGLLFISAVLDG